MADGRLKCRVLKLRLSAHMLSRPRNNRSAPSKGHETRRNQPHAIQAAAHGVARDVCEEREKPARGISVVVKVVGAAVWGPCLCAPSLELHEGQPSVPRLRRLLRLCERKAPLNPTVPPISVAGRREDQHHRLLNLTGYFRPHVYKPRVSGAAK